MGTFGMMYRLLLPLLLALKSMPSNAAPQDRSKAVGVAVLDGREVVNMLMKDTDATIVNAFPPKIYKKLYSDIDDYLKTATFTVSDREIADEFGEIVKRNFDDAEKIMLDKFSQVIDESKHEQNDLSVDRNKLSKATNLALQNLLLLAKKTILLKLEFPDIVFEPIETLSVKQMHDLIKICDDYIAEHDATADRQAKLAVKSRESLNHFLQTYDDIHALLPTPFRQVIKTKISTNINKSYE